MADDTTPPAGSMFALGWLMARLFGPFGQQAGPQTWTHLPATSELDPDDSASLAFIELDALLPSGLSGAAVQAAWQADGHAGFTAAVGRLHLQVMQALAADHAQLAAYEVGRALSDTCGLPSQMAGQPGGGTFVLAEFGREPLAALQTWLAQASSVLPAQSAATVSRSLQNWQNWADVNADVVQGSWAQAATSAPVLQALRTQGSVWYSLLSGQTDMDGQLSVDAWIQAGQSIAKTTGRLVRMVLRRFWPAVLIALLVTAGLLFLAIDKSSGTAKVWTSLITVAATFGVTGASLMATVKKAADALEQDIEKAAEVDARAWSVTWLPTLSQSLTRRGRLAHRGVAAPQVKTNLEHMSPPPALPPRLTEPPSVPPPPAAIAPPAPDVPAAPQEPVAGLR